MANDGPEDVRLLNVIDVGHTILASSPYIRTVPPLWVNVAPVATVKSPAAIVVMSDVAEYVPPLLTINEPKEMTDAFP